MNLSVIIPTHNPDRGRLARTLAALAAQTLPAGDWETLVVDNASTPALAPEALPSARPENLRIVREPRLGLTSARRRGLDAAAGDFLVFVDDDNLLAPDYLAGVIRCFAGHPTVGALGGRSIPEFETLPPAWIGEFLSLLAVRDLGSEPLIDGLRPAPAGGHLLYPPCAPIGAGMALRREAARRWAAAPASGAITDRRGANLTSGGDNDIVLTLLHAGWQVGYFPELQLTHLIPASRLDAAYLARLNQGIQRSWMEVLRLHGANPWEPLTPAGARLRQIKAWLHHQPWRGPVERIRWAGACGHFAGRVRRFPPPAAPC